jgi:hypothetical protein
MFKGWWRVEMHKCCPFDAILVDPINNNKYIDYDICLAMVNVLRLAIVEII